jgi:dienelactone hydrolase
MNRLCLLAVAVFVSLQTFAANQRSNADQQLAEYFRVETIKLSERCLPESMTLANWQSHREEYRRQLLEMIGLWPIPERTDLKPVITGRLDHEEFTVEKLQFQALPHLYVTANLFVPKNLTNPAPTILYECGHWRLVTNGISYGNKAAYQADGAWYARNGYVCLVTDTLLAGEIQGIHTGTRDRGLWWWNSRGYTPAGVEAWFGMRALDYLSTRPEVDTNRFGITGHSGGGAYSWMITALDDRIKVAAPLAGMADAQSHILDGVIDSHCDCNFFVNYYRWDFPQVAALVAPRPLLLGGTDNDRLFNLANTERIHDKLRRVYQLYKATNKLGLVIAPGPHDEVPELQLGVMRWFNRYLKNEELPIETTAKRLFAPEDVRVFQTLPADSINTNIAESFVPLAKPVNRSPDELRTLLREKVFAGWPEEESRLEPKRAFEMRHDNLRLRAWDFSSQANVNLRLYLLDDAASKPAETVSLSILDRATAEDWTANVRAHAGLHADRSESLAGEFAAKDLPEADAAVWERLKREVMENHSALAFFAPRGVGLDAWSGDEKAQTKIRRRFMLLGQTVDAMRVWDIRRAIQAIHQVREDDHAKIALQSADTMAVNALYAALFEPNVKSLRLQRLPESHLAGPDYLGVLKICDIPDVINAVESKAAVTIIK